MNVGRSGCDLRALSITAGDALQHNARSLGRQHGVCQGDPGVVYMMVKVNQTGDSTRLGDQAAVVGHDHDIGVQQALARLQP